MITLNNFLIRIKYALESLDYEKQKEVVEYIEFQAGQDEFNGSYKMNLFENEGKIDAKKVN